MNDIKYPPESPSTSHRSGSNSGESVSGSNSGESVSGSNSGESASGKKVQDPLQANEEDAMVSTITCFECFLGMWGYVLGCVCMFWSVFSSIKC